MIVLIVDDIPRVVENVRNGVGWDTLGVETVLCACSVREAKSILNSQPVDVLLCDIEMPFQNGFDLLIWCHQQRMDLECIFLTAHADFEYARTALSLGGFDYILQPASLGEIEEAVKRACDRLMLKRTKAEKAQRGTHQRRLPRAARAPEQRVLIRRAAEKTLDIGEKRRFLRLDAEQIIEGDIAAQGDRHHMRLALIAHTDKHIASGKNIEQTGSDGMGNGHSS